MQEYTRRTILTALPFAAAACGKEDIRSHMSGKTINNVQYLRDVTSSGNIDWYVDNANNISYGDIYHPGSEPDGKLDIFGANLLEHKTLVLDNPSSYNFNLRIGQPLLMRGSPEADAKQAEFEAVRKRFWDGANRLETKPKLKGGS